MDILVEHTDGMRMRGWNVQDICWNVQNINIMRVGMDTRLTNDAIR